MSTIASPVNGISGITAAGSLLANNAKAQETERRFASLMDGVSAGLESGSEKITDTRLNGDYISSLAYDPATPANHEAKASGAAANAGQSGTIDKTSKLYEQSMELESLVVKVMLDSMKGTVVKSGLGGNTGFAAKMYEDMLYDELARDMTKNAGFGLADQIYLQLSSGSEA